MNCRYLVAFVILFFSFNSYGSENHSDHAKLKNQSLNVVLVSRNELEAGKINEVTLLISTVDGYPILPENMQLVHTQKIHALIIDPSLQDYHHAHPLPTNKPGEYKFSFIPKTANNYRIWLDITPAGSTRQYITIDLKGKFSTKIAIQKKNISSGIIKLNYKTYQLALSFDEVPQVGKALMGKIHITDNSNKDFKELQPVMGAFAHIVGFYDDYKSIAHIHPLGTEPASSSEVGGPDLDFHLEPEKKGFLKLFVQMRIEDQDIFVPFGINIE